MTREEAIRHGYKQLEIFGGEHYEFIKMAIKALEQEPCLNSDEKGEVKQEIKQEPCEDAISRDAVHKLRKYVWVGGIQTVSLDDIDELPSVTPSRPKGRCNICKWYDEDGIYNPNCENCCRNYKDNYCGAEMVESQERSDKE
jgi:hypothetical protein